MLSSPAFRALSLTDIEFSRVSRLNCAGMPKDNGRLIVTYKDFKRYGIHHHAIGPGLRELEALGFIEIVQRELAGNADHRRPHMFRLTYQPADHEPATDEWQQIKTEKEAEEIATRARTNAPPRPVSQCRKTPKPVPETGTEKPSFSVPETGTKEPKSPVPENGATF